MLAVSPRLLPTLSPLAKRAPAEGGTDLFLQRMVEACASELAVLDESGKVLHASKAWLLSSQQNAVPASVSGAMGKSPDLPQSNGPALHSEMGALAADIQRILDHHEREFHGEFSCNGTHGTRWFLVHAARLEVPESASFRVLVTREDITRRRQAEEELRTLGGRLIKAQEDERSRIARELHDDLSQQLAILGIELDQLRQRLSPRQADLTPSLERLWDRSQEISTAIHRLSYQLHPAKLDQLGLATAVKSLCQELAQLGTVEILFEHDGFPDDVPKEITLHLFRIAQESLRNVIKHSKAKTARVLLRATPKVLHLRITDDGCGFDSDSAEISRGLGFISMRERLRLIGGEISIRSRRGQGTQIDVWIPLSQLLSCNQ